jgi:hypothetical protein
MKGGKTEPSFRLPKRIAPKIKEAAALRKEGKAHTLILNL